MISVNNLTKDYGQGKGVFDLSFTVKQGEVFGYLGPNGAGKTTTIRHLLGFLNANQGNCTISGLDCRTKSAQIMRDLGYIPGEMAFFENMTGHSFLQFIGELRGKDDAARKDALIDRFDLDASSLIKKMSKGMKQKLGIVAAFMHDPSIYILDEPTSGLDPLMQSLFIDLIKEENANGKTILMSSHNFDEIDKSCDRAGIIKEGRLVAVANVHELKSAHRKIYYVSVGNQNDVASIKNSTLDVLDIKGLTLKVAVKNNYDEFISILSKCTVKDIDVVSQSLEQAFMQYYAQEVKS